MCSPNDELPLGDYTAAVLATLGIDKKFYCAIKEHIGLAPECNCSTRQEMLNNWGRKAKEFVRRQRPSNPQ